mgnify:FL=1
MSMLGKRIVFIGAPGVGKGTFAKLLCKRWNIPHICVGDMLRDDVNKSAAGSLNNSGADEIAIFMKRGMLIPDSTICKYVGMKLKTLGNDNTRSGYILDGFPRSKAQVKYLLDNDFVDVVVHITLDRWVSIDKILGRRRCVTCGNDFNVANVMTDGYNMPPILPTDEGYQCPQIVLGKLCEPNFSTRSDDNVESLTKRLESYDVETTVAVESFKEFGGVALHHFPVKKGIEEADDLAEVIMQWFNIRK